MGWVSCSSCSPFLLDGIPLGGLLGKSLILGILELEDLVHMPFGSIPNERTHSLRYRTSQAIKETRPKNEQYEDKENRSHEGS